jgi:hypothetical protein
MVLLWHAVPVNSVADLKAREVAVGVPAPIRPRPFSPGY